MDAWQRTFDQLHALLRGLSAAQRVSLLVVSLGVLAGMGWLIWSSAGPTDDFLLGGKTFTPDELKETQSALKAAGLTQFKVVGQRISVPAREADRYTAAAIARQTLPAQFAAEFDRMQSKVNLFTSSEQRRELLEEARKTRLAQILRSIPEIEEAIVEWDRPRQVNLFRPAPQVAAHVSVKPRGGRELSPELIQSLKLFVAGALAGAQTDDVTVVDMNTSRVYGRRSPADAANERIQSLVKQHESEYSSQIARALGHISDVLVTVKVDLVAEDVDGEPEGAFINSRIVPVSHRLRKAADLRGSRSNRLPPRRSEPVSVVRAVRGVDLELPDSNLKHDAEVFSTDTDAESGVPYRHVVQVAVSIPESYFAEIVRARGMSPGTSLTQDSAYRAALANVKAETQHDVREKLTRLLPDNGDRSAISVTTHTSLKAPAEKAAPSLAVTSNLPFEVNFDEWKLGAGLAMCGVCLASVLYWLSPRRHELPVISQESNAVGESQPEAPTADSTPARDDAIAVNSHSPAAVLDELAELERRTPATAVQRETPFAFLDELAVWDIARLLQSEHPQTIALVATALAPAQAAAVLHSLPESLRWDVTQRLTRIGPTAPDVLCEVAASLKSRLHSQTASTGTNWHGDKSPLSHHREAPSTISSAAVPSTSSWPLTFEDLRSLDLRSLTTVLESVDLRACAVALLDRSDSFKQALFALMPKHIATAVRQHLRQLGPVRLVDINVSQQAIAGVAWKLAQHGMIVLPAHLENAA